MRRNAIRDILLLTAICWGTYFVGLTTHGLTNWQEAQRAVAAREMQSRGEWIVPTVDGRPYLAKPPMVYWWQLTLAELRGATTGEFELRLTVALAGWLGVLGAYGLVRRMEPGLWEAYGSELEEVDGLRPRAGLVTHGDIAWWSSLFLATGFLYARSSRIGELDILLVPFTVLAIAGVHMAWRRHLAERRTHIPGVLLAVVCASAAMLTKGPPGIVGIAVAAYGGVALWYSREGSRRRVLAASVAGVTLAVCAVIMSWPAKPDFRDFAGIPLYACMGGAIGWVASGLTKPASARAAFLAYSRTHPVAVIAVPFLALWGWGKLVAARIGPEALEHAVRSETADNLRVLVLGSPVQNLEAAVYGVGLGSFAAIGGAVWLARRRARWTPELCIVVAWVVGGLIAFSLLGKGVGRYLTPLWPGIALLGGLWWVRTLPRLARPRLVRGFVLVVVAGMAVGQGVWYGYYRERLYPERSPRAMVMELLAIPAVSPDRLAMLEFETPAVDFYVGRRVESLENTEPKPWLSGTRLRSLADLRESMSGSDRWTLLVREGDRGATMLRSAGFEVLELPLQSRFVIENGRTEIRAVRISLPSAFASPPGPPGG
jgi:4-amino-4-deoxy-L-arabinose transferase-like glycosyltransferase